MSALSLQRVTLLAHDRRVLEEISLEVPEGGRVAIFGRNGAGKTTLARVAAGLLRPTSGSVRVFGSGWEETSLLPELRRRAGVGLAQGALLSDLTVAENVRAALGPLRPSAERRAVIQVERLLADVGAEYCADRSLGALSSGERRRVDLARILATGPELLILDDVLAGVDQQGAEDLEQRIDRLVARRRRALLWLGGDLSLAARLAPVVFELEAGRLRPALQQSDG